MKKNTGKIVFFLVFLAALYLYPFYRIVSGGGIEKNGGFVFLIMWIPAISAIATKLIFDRNLKGLGFKPGKLGYLGLSLVIPIIAGFIVYPIAWISGIGGLDTVTANVILRRLVITVGVGLVSSMLSAVGEEIGWRGFLVPELAKRNSFTKTALILAVIWNIYHYPLLIFGGYNSGESIALAFLFFTVSVTGVCFITAWLRLKSGSMWGPALLHAAHNFFIQNVFDSITITKTHTKLFTTEFGIGLAVVYLVIAFIFWKNRDALPQSAPEQTT